MGIAALVLGIVSILLSLIPVFGIIGFIPALIGLILGIVELVKVCKKAKTDEKVDPKVKSKKGMSISGIVLSSMAIFIMIVWIVFFGVLAFINRGFQHIDDYNYDYDSDYSIPTSNLEFKQDISLGQTFRSDAFNITFDSRDENYKNFTSSATVKSGYKVIKATFTVENIGKSSEYISSSDFDCYADNYSCDKFYSFSDTDKLSATLSVGKKVTGSVYFEVPENANHITLEFEDDYLSTNRIANFIIK